VKGEPAWPPLALFRAMLLAVWCDLSDVKLAEALDDRASFRRYCGFSAAEATPERTAFVRFRKALIAQNLDKALFDEIAAQLRAKAVRVKTGTLVDAAVIASASQDDDEARWVKHKGRPAAHGFKAHVYANIALVEEIAITPANVNDGKAAPQALPEEPGAVFADSAYRGKTFRDAVQTKGGSLRVAARSVEPADPLHSRPYRKNLRNVETQLWPSTHALERACQGGLANPLHSRRLQHQAMLEYPRSRLTDAPRVGAGVSPAKRRATTATPRRSHGQKR